MSRKKLSLSSVCKNILMVCGTVTALTGALGGVMDVVSKHSKSSSNEEVVIESGVDREIDLDRNTHKKGVYRPELDIMEQSDSSGDVPEVDMVMSSGVDSDGGLGDKLRGVWVWVMGIGIIVVGVILMRDRMVSKSSSRVEEFRG